MPVFKQRRGTSTALHAANEVVADGQIVFESDTNRIKIDNGNDPYNDLEYLDNEILIGDVQGLTSALQGKQAAGQYATLVDGKIPAAQLPAYVDDVREVANAASLPGAGESGVIYVTLDTNRIHRWTGSQYTEVSASPGTTDDVSEGSVNLYFTGARAVSALAWHLSGKSDTDHEHSYTEIIGLGSVVTLSVPSGGADAGAGEVVIGSDSRLTDNRTPVDGSVTEAKLAAGSVTTDKIADGAVTTSKINASFVLDAGLVT
jgi:hypothetical protein